MTMSPQRPAEPPIPAGEDLAFAGVARRAELLRAGEVTPRELVELYLARIERLDPKLNAFVHRPAECRSCAQEGAIPSGVSADAATRTSPSLA